MDRFEPTEFSASQWEFLSVVELFAFPVSIDTVGELSPLKAGELLDVFEKGENYGLISRRDNNFISLVPGLPKPVQKKFNKINTPDRISVLLAHLKGSDTFGDLPVIARANLLVRAGHSKEAAKLEINMGRDAVNDGKLEKAVDHFFRGLDLYSSSLGNQQSDVDYVEAVLELTDLHFILGRAFDEILPLLDTARTVAVRLGDLRSQALIDFNGGILLGLGGNDVEGMKRMDMGRKVVEELGDQDIKKRAAIYLGCYYYGKGRIKQAAAYMELAVGDIEDNGIRKIINPIAPVTLATCLLFLNQFYRALGYIDYHLHRAKSENQPTLIALYQAFLGYFLIRIDKEEEAYSQLSIALKDAISQNNLFAAFLARIGISYYHYNMQSYDEAREMIDAALKGGTQERSGFKYLSPHLLEILAGLEQKGKAPIPGYEFDRCFLLAMNSQNIHLRGVALRLRAERLFMAKSNNEAVTEDLRQSEMHLQESEDQYELAKTQALLAQQMLSEGKMDEAGRLANEARKGLSGHGEVYFPDSLRPITKIESYQIRRRVGLDEFRDQVIKTFKEAYIPLDRESIHNYTVSVLIRFFGAERGGLFWANEGNCSGLSLKAAHNLSLNDVGLPSFKYSMNLIRKSFQENRPLKIEKKVKGLSPANSQPSSLICLPLQVGNSVFGILYYDNTYFHDCFEDIDKNRLDWLAEQLSQYVELAQHVNQLMEDTKSSLMKRSRGSGIEVENHIIFRSSSMSSLLQKVDKIAQSESSILILGETGVGKELLARRVHLMGKRSAEPFVTFDPSSVPENLTESELFGHEKGSFTGADRNRHGLIELAHHGTLFIDEIGEFPKNIQVKLLRVLQEKTFRRVGSNRMRMSDFRLVAATNRDLAKEVASGSFREDLYYRLNTITLTIPPLRERKEDIALLASHFLSQYAKKYYYPQLNLTTREKSLLADHHWPGNVRELKNVVEQAVILSDGRQLEITLPIQTELPPVHPFSDLPSLDELQKRYIQYVLEKTHGKISGPDGAATLMGIKRTTLYHRMKKLGLRT